MVKTKCEMVRYRDATASSLIAKFRGEIFVPIHAVAVKGQVVCGIDCLASQDELSVNSPSMLKYDEHALLFF
jgi:hypothetical protein